MANRREQLLLVLFLSALLVAGGTLGGNAALRHLRGQEKILRQKEGQLEEVRLWLQEKETWEARGAWLAAHPLPSYEGQQTEAAFVQEVQGSLSKHGVEILEQRMQESVAGRAVVEVGIDLVLQSSLEQLVRWLHDTRKADAYRAIRQIRIKSDAQSSTMRAEISLVRFYQKSPR